MSIVEYTEIVAQKWKEYVDARVGLDIYSDVEIDIAFNTEDKNNKGYIKYSEKIFAYIYESNKDNIDYEISLINPKNLAEIAENYDEFIKVMELPAALLDAIRSIDETSIEVKVNYTNNWW